MNLILDEDGLYDPAHFNDRLLLGLKGTMSEAELHVLKAPARGDFEQGRVRGLKLMDPLRKVARGRRRDQMKVIMTPEERARQQIDLEDKRSMVIEAISILERACS